MKKEDIIKMQIARVKKEIRDTPYDKASEHHHARLKAKLAKLEDQLEGPVNKAGGGGGGYAVKHEGDACVVLVGPPSVGKSSLLNALTNAKSKVGDYEFTTLGVVPGMMEYRGVKIQLLDLPGLVEGAGKNIGFGKRVLAVIRGADLVVLTTDVDRLDWLEKMEKELDEAGIRLGEEKPKISVKRTSRGAIQVVDAYQSFKKQVVVDVARELGFKNAVVQINEPITSLDRLVDGLMGNRKYMSVVRLVNKIDKVENYQFGEALAVSVKKRLGLDELKQRIWQELGLVRVYLKRGRHEPADKTEPLILKRGQVLAQVVRMISGQMAGDIKWAYIWGKEAKFGGQKVSLSRPVFDQMEVWFGR